jgi:hypothetical protein
MKRRESREEGGVAEWVTVMKMKEEGVGQKKFWAGEGRDGGRGTGVGNGPPK